MMMMMMMMMMTVVATLLMRMKESVSVSFQAAENNTHTFVATNLERRTPDHTCT